MGGGGKKKEKRAWKEERKEGIKDDKRVYRTEDLSPVKNFFSFPGVRWKRDEWEGGGGKKKGKARKRKEGSGGASRR